MKKLMKFLLMAMLSLFIATAFFACSNDDDMPTEVETRARVEELPPLIITSKTLYSNVTYRLTNKTFVLKGATLTIQPGTRIEGVYNSNPKKAAALIITRGAKIIANGTASDPIVMTAQNGKIGGWGGLVILGNGAINQPESKKIEGISVDFLPPDWVDVKFGTPAIGKSQAEVDALNSESSGSLKYVRVEYAGTEIAPADELNAFTFGGVGSGTVLEHLQAYKGKDDSFEFFGGAANAKYLVSTGTHDDSFDFDFGYQGKIQFAVAIIDRTLVHSKDPNGIECDNDGQSSQNTPYTHPVLSNLTLVGTVDGKVFKTTNNTGLLKSAANFRRNTRFTLVNSVAYGFPKGILKETNNSFILKNNVISSVIPGNEFATFTADASNKAVAVDGIILDKPWGGYKEYFDLQPIDGPAYSGASFVGLDTGFFKIVSYKGAFSDIENVWTSESWVR